MHIYFAAFVDDQRCVCVYYQSFEDHIGQIIIPYFIWTDGPVAEEMCILSISVQLNKFFISIIIDLDTIANDERKIICVGINTNGYKNKRIIGFSML